MLPAHTAGNMPQQHQEQDKHDGKRMFGPNYLTCHAPQSYATVVDERNPAPSSLPCTLGTTRDRSTGWYQIRSRNKRTVKGNGLKHGNMRIHATISIASVQVLFQLSGDECGRRLKFKNQIKIPNPKPLTLNP